MAGYSKRKMSKVSMVYIAIGVLLIVVMTIAGTSAFMKTTGFIVEGAFVYTAEEVVEASGLSMGDNLLFINSQNASLRIREELPYVIAVNITRKLPNIVHIEITESVAIAFIRYAGEVYVIDSAGRVLDRVGGGNFSENGVNTPTGNRRLIEVRGVDIEETNTGNTLRPVFGTETKLQYMKDVLFALEREKLEDDVSFLDINNIVNVHFGFMGKFNVILGGSTNLRPSNLRHSLSMLRDNVAKIEEAFPHTPGDIVFDESGQPRFRFD